jgi:clan AA aspartic protease
MRGRENKMGYVTADITIRHGGDVLAVKENKLAENEIRQVQVEALVDSGAFTLIINKDVQEQLQLPVLYAKPCRDASGNFGMLDVAGPVEVLFENRMTICEAVISPGLHQVLLGVIPLEGMDVVVNPVTRKLMVNPAHPDAGVMMMYGINV